MSTFQASAASLSPHPPVKNPAPQEEGAAGPRPGRGTRGRLTVAGRPPTPSLVLTLEEPALPIQPRTSAHLPPRAVPLPSIPKVPPSSQSPAGRTRSPTSPLAARRSPSTPAPTRAQDTQPGRGISGAHAYANIRAHLYERGGGGWMARAKAPRTCTSERASAAMLRAFPPPGARWAPLLPHQPLGWQRPLTPACVLRSQGARAVRPPTSRARVHLVAVPRTASGLGVRRSRLRLSSPSEGLL